MSMTVSKMNCVFVFAAAFQVKQNYDTKYVIDYCVCHFCDFYGRFPVRWFHQSAGYSRLLPICYVLT